MVNCDLVFRFIFIHIHTHTLGNFYTVFISNITYYIIQRLGRRAHKLNSPVIHTSVRNVVKLQEGKCLPVLGSNISLKNGLFPTHSESFRQMRRFFLLNVTCLGCLDCKAGIWHNHSHPRWRISCWFSCWVRILRRTFLPPEKLKTKFHKHDCLSAAYTCPINNLWVLSFRRILILLSLYNLSPRFSLSVVQ